VARVVREVKAGRVEFRVDRTGVLHAPIGKVSFEPDKLAENLGAFVDAITRAKPAGAKGQYLRSITLASSMGPGLKVDLAGAQALAAAG
jgi:large subunit ribosomal protein L1